MKTMKTIIPKLIPLTFLLSQVLVACGPTGVEGYEDAYDEFYEEVSVEDASDSNVSSELRRARRVSTKDLTCEDRGLDEYSKYIDVIDDWNDYVIATLSQSAFTSVAALKAGFETSFCPANNPLPIWAGGPPTCQMTEVPQPTPNGLTLDFEADATNPATIRYYGCVYKELEAELAEF